MRKKFIIRESWEIITINPPKKVQATQEIIEKLTPRELEFLIQNDFVLIYKLV